MPLNGVNKNGADGMPKCVELEERDGQSFGSAISSMARMTAAPFNAILACGIPMVPSGSAGVSNGFRDESRAHLVRVYVVIGIVT